MNADENIVPHTFQYRGVINIMNTGFTITVNNSFGYGGSVICKSQGTFEMNGSTISENTAYTRNSGS